MPDVSLRCATASDVPAIVALLADDDIGARRESPDDLISYEMAFTSIDDDPSEYLAVARTGGRHRRHPASLAVAGLVSARRVARPGRGVRVAVVARGQGLGETIMRWAIDEARARRCVLVQPTSDKARTDAHRFYARLGFVATHEGYKLPL